MFRSYISKPILLVCLLILSVTLLFDFAYIRLLTKTPKTQLNIFSSFYIHNVLHEFTPNYWKYKWDLFFRERFHDNIDFSYTSEEEYLSINPDVKFAIEDGDYKDGTEHFNITGKSEGRQTTYFQDQYKGYAPLKKINLEITPEALQKLYAPLETRFVDRMHSEDLHDNWHIRGKRYTALAKLRFNGENHLVKVRSRGEGPNHWANSFKSWRIEFIDVNAADKSGLPKIFNIVIPEHGINELIGFRIAKTLGLLSPYTEPAAFFINSKLEGYRLIEEQPGAWHMRRENLPIGFYSDPVGTGFRPVVLQDEDVYREKRRLQDLAIENGISSKANITHIINQRYKLALKKIDKQSCCKTKFGEELSIPYRNLDINFEKEELINFLTFQAIFPSIHRTDTRYYIDHITGKTRIIPWNIEVPALQHKTQLDQPFITSIPYIGGTYFQIKHVLSRLTPEIYLQASRKIYDLTDPDTGVLSISELNKLIDAETGVSLPIVESFPWGYPGGMGGTNIWRDNLNWFSGWSQIAKTNLKHNISISRKLIEKTELSCNVLDAYLNEESPKNVEYVSCVSENPAGLNIIGFRFPADVIEKVEETDLILKVDKLHDEIISSSKIYNFSKASGAAKGTLHLDELLNIPFVGIRPYQTDRKLNAIVKELSLNLAEQFPKHRIGLTLPSELFPNGNPKHIEMIVQNRVTGITSIIKVNLLKDNSIKPQISSKKLIATDDEKTVTTNLPSFLSKVGANVFEFSEKTVKITKPLILPPGSRLIAKPGTKIIFSNSAYIYTNGTIEFIGEKSSPVLLISENIGKNGGIIVANSQGLGKSILKYVVASGGLDTKIYKQKFTGLFNFYGHKVEIENSEFYDVTSEDAVNVKYGSAKFFLNKFTNVKSDAIDFDFSQGIVEHSAFKDIGNDAIDLNDSNIKILDVNVSGAGDKAISVGGWSFPTIERLTATKVDVGLQVKDYSFAEISDSIMSESRIGLHLHLKNTKRNQMFLKFSNLKFNNNNNNVVKDRGTPISGLQEIKK